MEATLTFKREGRDGIIPVGSYLSDAARRFGVLFEAKCILPEHIHHCQVTVDEGGGLLTPLTSEEIGFLGERPGNDRLACQARIASAGDIVVMTKEAKKAEAEADDAVSASERYSKEFAELPLEKKFSELVHLESIALGETVSFVLNSPYQVFGKVVDILAEFGFKKEEAGKRAARPSEHADDSKAEQQAPAEKSAGKAGESDSASAE